jgi:CDP-glycerol glycerophosphotransferase
VSPGPWWTPLLRDGFRFTGEVLETGLPCDDLFHDPGQESVAVEVRRRLGIARDRRVVLHVPGERPAPPLDLARVRSAGDDIVLVWRPPGVPAAWTGDGVRDVSAYPDPHGLYLVADVLVTGHVPAVFDFAPAGRPLLLHVDPHEELCLYPEAPGPSLHTTEEVIDALRDLAEVADKHAGALEAFLARFRPLADGGAAARVVDHIFR